MSCSSGGAESLQTKNRSLSSKARGQSGPQIKVKPNVPEYTIQFQPGTTTNQKLDDSYSEALKSQIVKHTPATTQNLKTHTFTFKPDRKVKVQKEG